MNSHNIDSLQSNSGDGPAEWPLGDLIMRYNELREAWKRKDPAVLSQCTTAFYQTLRSMHWSQEIEPYHAVRRYLKAIEVLDGLRIDLAARLQEPAPFDAYGEWGSQLEQLDRLQGSLSGYEKTKDPDTIRALGFLPKVRDLIDTLRTNITNHFRL